MNSKLSSRVQVKFPSRLLEGSPNSILSSRLQAFSFALSVLFRLTVQRWPQLPEIGIATLYLC